jgi:glycosyltransferase involved in cell wall biosynthesis
VTLWIDVEDLFEYALHYRRPSGIQRAGFQLCEALQSKHGTSGQVRFVRHSTARNSFYTVPWSDVTTLFDRLAAEQPQRSTRPLNPSADARRRSLRRLVHRLSPSLRASLIEALRMQGLALRAWWQAARAMAASVGSMTLQLAPGRGTVQRDDLTGHVGRGDVLLALGAPWSHPDYAGLIRAQRERSALRFGLLVHDLSALRHPEWFDRGLTQGFRHWFDDLLPLCDVVFAVSRATAADVTAYAAQLGVALPCPVVPLPLGTGVAGDGASPRQRLPVSGSYVLFVSTIEARKNHALLFRVWQKLLEEMPRDAVPTLVFAGRVGWLVDDLMQQIVNTDHLSGRLVVIENASDSELAALYRGCLFTVYPSFFEGWGLPVTESLAFGKPCLASDRTALPEAGGDLARYIDPDDLHGWYAAIRAILADPPQLTPWAERIRREFRPVTWSATASALLAGLHAPPGTETGTRSSSVGAVAALAASCSGSS